MTTAWNRDTDGARTHTPDSIIRFNGTSNIALMTGAPAYLDNGSTSVTVEGDSDTVNSGFSGNTVGFTGTNDTAQISNGRIDTNATSVGSLTIQGSGDSDTTIAGTTQSYPALTAQTVSDIDAIYNAVLDRDAAPADLVSAQIVLASGGNLTTVMSAVANSAELQADMASTYAAEGVAAPTATKFTAFADAMSTSYGSAIELVSIDPATGAQTELADTSTTNLLAELPVLETQANGVNLGLQLADGTVVQFASTQGVADFLYAVSVQQMQATSFVTDNYTLDTQWLNTVDQPLLNNAVKWTEQAASELAQGAAAVANLGIYTGYTNAVLDPYDQKATIDNTAANLALQIAGEAPASRQNAEVTISSDGVPTQITVYTNGGCTVHSLNGGITGYIEEAVSTLVSIAAVVTGQYYLYLAAAAIDTAQAGQAFANGQDLAGVLSLAEAVSAGILGGTGGTAPLGTTPVPAPTVAQTVAQEINVAAEAVGGVYGVVKSAETGNGIGILAGALEAAAAAASGIGIYAGPGQAQQILSTISTALGAASVATNMGGDFASGNLAQGLVDSLNLYLPAEALANASYQNSLTYLDNGAWETVDAVGTVAVALNSGGNSVGLSPAALYLDTEGAGTAPINSGTLGAPGALWFSDGVGPVPMALPINDLTLPAFFHPGADLLTAAPGYFGVAGDGSPPAIIGPNGTVINADQLAALIRSNGWQPGQLIQLFSCNTGVLTENGDQNIAQKLAIILDTTVAAPSTFLWTYSDGTYTNCP